ncbi:MAG: tRNA glutamyl-Q(34) synthetase GluQRS [Pseudomonadota bacterium]
MANGYVGRFAPSPTGDLHIGSLLAAVGSYAQALHHRGQWLLRIEDVDRAREVDGAALRQIADLRRFGMVSPRPVEYQHNRRARHEHVIQHLLDQDRAFHCGCSRADLPPSGVYPGTCRTGLASGQSPRSIRFRVPDQTIRFHDGVFGDRTERLTESVGDVVIRRADGMIAYQLAVVVDDIDQGVTEVVRGADLLASTARQIALWLALGQRPPEWLHLPLIVDDQGQKLGKSSAADPVHRLPELNTLLLVLRCLGQRPPSTLRSIASAWAWVETHWNPRLIPKAPIRVSELPIYNAT